MQDGEPAAPSSSICQVSGCGVNLNRLRPYFRRQRICEEHARAESVPDGRGGLARFCQQCTRLEPLSFFDGQRRSCRSSLAKRQERMNAARRRTHSGSDERLSSSNSDGPEGAGEEASGAATRRAAWRAAAGGGSPHSSAAPLQHKRSRSTSPPARAVGPAAAPLAGLHAAGAALARPLAATFPSPAGLLQPKASGEHADSSAATARLGLLLPSVLAGLLGASPAGASMPAASAAPVSTVALTSTTQTASDATAFLASLPAANGSSRTLPMLDGSGGSTLSAVAAAVAAAAAPLSGGARTGQSQLPLPSDPHELRRMLSTLLQLQALIGSVLIPQVQQRLAVMELGDFLGALGPQGMAAAAQPLLSLVQQPVAVQPAPGLQQLGGHGSAVQSLPGAAQDAVLAQLLGSLASRQQEGQQQQQQAQQAPPPQPLEQRLQQPVQQQLHSKQSEQAQPQASVQQLPAELPAAQLASVIQQLLGQ